MRGKSLALEEMKSNHYLVLMQLTLPPIHYLCQFLHKVTKNFIILFIEISFEEA